MLSRVMLGGLVVLLIVSLQYVSAMPVSASSPTGDVVDQINAIRVQNGLAPLTVASELTASAQSYARTLAQGKFFAHVGLDGSTMVSRDQAAGYVHWTYLEENLAAGQASATAAVSAWMQSPTHRADILSPRVTETGVGYVFLSGSPFGYYWVQEFGARPGSAGIIAAPILPPSVPTLAPTAMPKAITPPPTPTPIARPTSPAVTTIVAAIKPNPSPTTISVAATPQPVAPITAIDRAHTTAFRTQRDPDNLNLYFYNYQSLGINLLPD